MLWPFLFAIVHCQVLPTVSWPEERGDWSNQAVVPSNPLTHPVWCQPNKTLTFTPEGTLQHRDITYRLDSQGNIYSLQVLDPNGTAVHLSASMINPNRTTTVLLWASKNMLDQIGFSGEHPTSSDFVLLEKGFFQKSPIIFGTLFYKQLATAILFSIDTKDGSLLWWDLHYDLAYDQGFISIKSHPLGIALVSFPTRLDAIIPPRVATAPYSSAVKWSFNRSYGAAPVVSSNDHATIYDINVTDNWNLIPEYAFSILQLDPATGTLERSYPLPTLSTQVLRPPCFAFATNQYLVVRQFSDRYKRDATDQVFSLPKGKLVFNQTKGSNIDTPGPSSIPGSFICHNDTHLFLQDLSTTYWAFEYRVWRQHLSPHRFIVVDQSGVLYLPTARGIEGRNLISGEPLWELSTHGAFTKIGVSISQTPQDYRYFIWALSDVSMTVFEACSGFGYCDAANPVCVCTQPSRTGATCHLDKCFFGNELHCVMGIPSVIAVALGFFLIFAVPAWCCCYSCKTKKPREEEELESASGLINDSLLDPS